MTYRPPTRQRAQSQEDRLLDLLRKAESYANALAHGYDIGGHPDRAYELVALGERIRDTATDVSEGLTLAKAIVAAASPGHSLRAGLASSAEIESGSCKSSSVTPRPR
jgi:hypothetical protein